MASTVHSGVNFLAGAIQHERGPIGFYGAEPVYQADALTPVEEEDISGAEGADDLIAVIENLRTRQVELETALIAYGLLAAPPAEE